VFGLVAFASLVGIRLLGARSDLKHGQRALVAARRAMTAGEPADAATALRRARASFRHAKQAAGLPASILDPIPVIGSAPKAARQTADAGLHLVAAGGELNAVVRSLSSDRDAVKADDLAPVHRVASTSPANLARAQAHLVAAQHDLGGPQGALLPPISGPARGAAKVVAGGTRQLRRLRASLGVVADLTAPDADVKLLILSQDTFEQRASGGFIGSLGVLHFAHGGVSLENYRSYEELPLPRPAVPAPANLAPWLRGRPWEISNSNWWPDFPTTASAAREMFARQTGEQVDGVVALTQEVLGPIVGMLGQVDVPGYQTPVTQASLEDRILYEVELKRPRDNPRKKFLSALSTEVMDRVFELPQGKLLSLARVVGKTAVGGSAQAWFANPHWQDAVRGSSWDGALPRTDGDFLMMVDTNMWESKANRYVTHNVEYTIERDSSGLVGHLRADYRNDGDPGPADPAYLAYVRIYVPSGARLLDGQANDEGPAPDGPYRVLSTQLLVGNHEQKTVDVSYTLPASVAPGGHYRLTWVRQVGTGGDRLRASVAGRSVTVGARTTRFGTWLEPQGLPGWLHRRWLLHHLGL
jgi:hypothetical protein